MSNNPSGNNQWGKKDCIPGPSLDQMRGPLTNWATRQVEHRDQCSLFEREFGVSIGKTQLVKFRNALEIPSVRRTRAKPEEETRQQYLDCVGLGAEGQITNSSEVRGIGRSKGREDMRKRGIMISYGQIREIQKLEDPVGLHRRDPKKGKKERRRGHMVSTGFGEKVSGDGHEKLGQFALQMGRVSLHIYGMREHWAGYIAAMVCMPNDRDRVGVAHVMLDAFEDLGGVPQVVVVDHGTETDLGLQTHAALRELQASHLTMRSWKRTVSSNNILIELVWRQWRDSDGALIAEWLNKGRDVGCFDESIDLHVDLCHWIWYRIIQLRLNTWRDNWNTHKTRYDPKSLRPSGHRPIDAMEDPGSLRGVSVLVPVPLECFQEARQHLGPRPFFYTEQFDQLGEWAWRSVGSPMLEVTRGWAMFPKMLAVIEEYLRGQGIVI
ncbi:hypothetical protein P7C70_g205, partial [Phenoliferia sp. Uapishka_3]